MQKRAKKCTKNRDAIAKLLFYLWNPLFVCLFFLTFSLPSASLDLKVPFNETSSFVPLRLDLTKFQKGLGFPFSWRSRVSFSTYVQRALLQSFLTELFSCRYFSQMAVLLILRAFLYMLTASRSYNVPDMNVDLRYLQNWLIANRLTQNVLKRNTYVGRFEAKDCYCHTRTRARSSYKLNFI